MNVYRINYTYVAANGQLRSGAIVLEAAHEDEASELALAGLPASQKKWAKVTSASLYISNIAAKKK